ncbi:hypothetical protein [Anoxynatronum sibiricum]|uniref:Uncharacterized protein n=1 Tax=Anoxynatronum sibiricum TaxID=210623 RepID=A0ABU9VW33_9CLOT
MFLIFISIFTGYLGLAVGSAMGAEGALSIVGFLCPSIFVLQKVYLKLEKLEELKKEEAEEVEKITET